MNYTFNSITKRYYSGIFLTSKSTEQLYSFSKQPLKPSLTLTARRGMSGKAPEAIQVGLIVREVFNRFFSLTTNKGKKAIKIKAHKYKIYKGKADEIPEAAKVACQQKGYLDSGFINIYPSKEVAKLNSLAKPDKYGRLYEYFDSMIRIAEMAKLNELQHWSNYEVVSREASNFKSLMPKNMGGLYGKYRVDQTILEYNHYIYWMYGEKDYSKAMFREVKSTWVADILGRIDSIKKDSTFKLPQSKLLELVKKLFDVNFLSKSTEITKQISLWVDGLKPNIDEVEENENLSEITSAVQAKVENLNEESPDLFEDLDEIDIYFQDSSLEDSSFLLNPEKELIQIVEQKAIEYKDFQSSDDS